MELQEKPISENRLHSKACGCRKFRNLVIIFNIEVLYPLVISKLNSRYI